MNDLVDINSVKDRLLMVRGEPSLLDRDVAALYGVETKRVMEAVRNNRSKFPDGYLFELSKAEVDSLRSKISSLEAKPGRGRHSKHGYKAFTEKGLYMLATILKSKRATAATLAIVNAYAQLRSMVRDMEALQTESVGRSRRERRNRNSTKQSLRNRLRRSGPDTTLATLLRKAAFGRWICPTGGRRRGHPQAPALTRSGRERRFDETTRN